MILGNVNHLDLVPYLPAKIKQSIEYVKDNVCLLYTSPSPRDANPEYHKKYIDVQIVLEGQEGMAICTLPPHTQVLDDKIAENDIAFIKTPNEETMLVLQPNDFIVFLPNEVHKPLCAVDNKIATVRKVVVKIALNYL